MTRSAGDLDRRITVERYNESARDEFNEATGAWESYTTVWASRQDVSDAEKVTADQVNAVRSSRFVIRSSIKSRAITPNDRINYNSLLWDIHGIKETREGRKRFLEITAMAQAD